MATHADGHNDATQVRVPNYSFDPLHDGEPVLTGRHRFDGEQAGLRLVQFNGAPQDAWLKDLEQAGLRVLQYYPHNSYLVWGAQSAASAAESLGFVRWAGNFHPAYKISADLAARSGRIRNVDVFIYNDGHLKKTLASLEALGGKLIQAYPAQPDEAFYVAVVELNSAALQPASELGAVVWIGYSDPVPVLDDEMSDQIQAGNYNSPGGVPFTGYASYLGTLGYDGNGVRWAVIDDGVDYNHPDLSTNIVAGYSFPGCTSGQPGQDCSGAGHGTHVAGIIGGTAAGGFGDANGFKYGLGVAPGYGIVTLNALSGSAWPPTGGWQENSKQALALNAVGANNSWTTGEGTNHGYQASERTHDLIVRDGTFDTPTVIDPFIEVFSAGNSGPSANTLTAPKEAKNLIVVAASNNYRAGAINSVADFSSRGPSVDGRIVPTVAAPGAQIASTRSSNSPSNCQTAISGTSNLYSFCSGTSMAAPHVSGAVVLATQWWRTFNAGANPSPAMAKALLVNSAVPLATIPNMVEGWGRVNVTDLIAPDAATLYFDQTAPLTNSGAAWTQSFGVADPSKPLKITLAWSDAPGAPGANPALVNNLDLNVVVNGTSYRGNVFAGGWSTTAGSADALNNLENVYVQAPGNASINITVNATNIAGDGVPGNADTTDQDFALVCYNCSQFPDYTLQATPPTQAVCAPTAAAYTVNVGSIMGYTDPVTLSVSGNPSGTTTGFGTNPVTPGNSSALTIGNTAAATAGSYTLNLSATSTSGNKSANLGLDVFNAAPGTSTLSSPANGASNVPALPTFSWTAANQGATYSIEVASDVGFGTIVASASGLTGTSWTSNVTLNTSSTYFWRVWADNLCGTGSQSAISSFSTVAAPGDCGIGTSPKQVHSTTFESGLSGWAQGSGGTGTNTWAISAAAPHAGAQHVHANNTASVTDQRLVSPTIALPTGEDPVVLKFWHVPNNENSGATACYDGGILEVSSDAGVTWTQVPAANLLLGGYRGAISSSFSNPLGGMQAWCGETAYMQTIADMSSYAGQSVQFRFRLGTDSSVGKPGWDVDDVSVQSCEAAVPNSAVSPASLSHTQAANASSNHALTIGNTAGGTLTWNIDEEPGTGTCSSPASVPWLSVTPASGTTSSGGSTPTTVTLDSTGLAAGTYNANLCVHSDDPDTGPGNGTDLIVVPVTLTVDGNLIFSDGFEN